MSCALHDLQRSSPKQNANLEPRREFAPYFKRSAEMGGSKRAVNPLLWRLPRPLELRFTKEGAVCGGRRRRGTKHCEGVVPPMACASWEVHAGFELTSRRQGVREWVPCQVLARNETEEKIMSEELKSSIGDLKSRLEELRRHL